MRIAIAIVVVLSLYLGVAAHQLTLRAAPPQSGRSLPAPVYPGETIRVELWEEGAEFRLRARAVERDVVVLNNGRVVLA